MLKRFVIALCTLSFCWCKSINHPGVAPTAQPDQLDQHNTNAKGDMGENPQQINPETTTSTPNVRIVDVDFIKAQDEAIRKAAATNQHLNQQHRPEDKYKRQWNNPANVDL